MATPWQPQLAHSATSPEGLYIHVPFCFHKCHYCDFYSIVENDAYRHKRFSERMLGEMDALLTLAAAPALAPVSIFVGGGTPTFLDREAWRLLAEGLNRRLDRSRLAEFTIEANPETVEPELFTLLVDLGVTRVSMGAQSFQPALLKALERWHEPASVGRAVRIAREAGIGQVNLDLIFAIPGQDMAALEADLDAALALEPDHISYYGLTFEPNTALTRRMELGQVEPVDEDLAAAMYERILDRLAEAGLHHYEISNWARPGRTCRHNLIYWRNGDWLGIGPGAASHVGGQRWKNAPHLGLYLASRDLPPMREIEAPDPARTLGERLMMGLRLREGVARDWLDQALGADDPRRGVLEEAATAGLIEQTETQLRLTRRGLLLADAILTRLV